MFSAAVLRKLAVLAAAGAAHGAIIGYYGDANCSGPAFFQREFYLGYCAWGATLTACSENPGWAVLHGGSNSLDCPGIDVSGWSAWTSLGNCVPMVWGWMRMESTDCVAPGNAAPPMFAIYDGTKCGNSTGAAGRPYITYNGNIINSYPSARPDARTWFPASVSVNANDGSVSVFIFGASDATCSGPVLMSFEGVTAASADTQASGRCVQPTKGATTDRTKPAARLRLFAAAPAQNVGPSGASLGTGVVLSYFNDNACTQPAGGWDNKALNITGSQGPIGYAGYCLTGYAISGGESNKWASMLGFAGNDCDTMPTMSAILVKGVCTPIFWVSQWNGYSAGTGSVRQAPSATERKAPLLCTRRQPAQIRHRDGHRPRPARSAPAGLPWLHGADVQVRGLWDSRPERLLDGVRRGGAGQVLKRLRHQ